MIFLINLPLGIIGLLGALRFMPESRSPEQDPPGPAGHRADQHGVAVPDLSAGAGPRARLAGCGASA
jgi:hypothetical protein